MKRASCPSSLAAWALALLSSAALAVLFARAAPHLPAVPRVRFGLGYGCVVACLLVVARVAPEVGRLGVLLALVPSALPVAVGIVGRAPGDAGAAVAVLVGLLAAGTWVGSFLGGEIEHPGHLLPLAYASSLADALSVLSPRGPTARIVAEHPDVLAVVALPWSFEGGVFEPVLGAADVIMTALYFAACRKHGLSRGRASVALGAAYAALLALLLAFARPLPALPALGAAVVLAFPEARRMPSHDRAKALVAMAALTALAALVYFG